MLRPVAEKRVGAGAIALPDRPAPGTCPGKPAQAQTLSVNNLHTEAYTSANYDPSGWFRVPSCPETMHSPPAD